VHEFLECYISSEGPDHDTTVKSKNLWGMCPNSACILIADFFSCRRDQGRV
jgi:hypothetical protein